MDSNEFRKKYDSNHKCCPKCGSEEHISTLMGFILDMSKKEEYKNLNKCECINCGNIHIAHDRKPKTI